MKAILKKTVFWDNLKDSIAILGPSSELIAMARSAGPAVEAGIAIASLVGYIVSHLVKIWMKDGNSDGTPDILEEDKVG